MLRIVLVVVSFFGLLVAFYGLLLGIHWFNSSRVADTEFRKWNTKDEVQTVLGNPHAEIVKSVLETNWVYHQSRTVNLAFNPLNLVIETNKVFIQFNSEGRVTGTFWERAGGVNLGR